MNESMTPKELKSTDTMIKPMFRWDKEFSLVHT